MYSTDVTSINAATTYSTASSTIHTAHARTLTVTPRATGANASSSGTVTFQLEAMTKPGTWCTDNWVTITVDVADTAAKVGEPEIIDLAGVMAVRVRNITNGDASYAIASVNVDYGLERS